MKDFLCGVWFWMPVFLAAVAGLAVIIAWVAVCSVVGMAVMKWALTTLGWAS